MLERGWRAVRAASEHPAEMKTMPPLTSADVNVLFAEIRRYLAAIETFRREGREPHWAPERPAPA